MSKIEKLGTQGIRNRRKNFRIQEFGCGVGLSDNKFVVVVQLVGSGGGNVKDKVRPRKCKGWFRKDCKNRWRGPSLLNVMVLL